MQRAVREKVFQLWSEVGDESFDSFESFIFLAFSESHAARNRRCLLPKFNWISEYARPASLAHL